MNYDIQCYLQKDDGESTAINTKSLWPGMYVLEAGGLADYGKAKNIVTESYADGQGLRSYIPSDGITREATDVTLKLCFFDEGGDRYAQYDSFIAYVEDCLVWYWDSVRNRKVHLLFIEKSSPEENFHGALEYIIADVKFKNVDGMATQLEGWSFAWSDHVCVRNGTTNTGVGRYKTLTLTNTGESEAYDITAAFGSYEALSNAQFASLLQEAYLGRLDAFNTYVIGQMALYHPDFDGEGADMTVGAYGAMADCPIDEQWVDPDIEI